MATRPPLLARLAGRLTENLPWRILSLTLAVAMWAWVQSGEVVDARTRARVRYVWPEGLVRARQVPKTLVVTIRGPQGVVRQADREDVEVVVDLSEAEQGTIPVDFTALELRGLPTGVEVVQVSPPAVDVELDRALSREVEVRPTLIGEPAPGWVVASVTVEPASVQLTGPRGTMKDVALVATDVIDLSGVRSDLVVDTALAITERVVGLAPGAPGRVKVTIDLDAVLVERTFEEAPVEVAGRGWVARPSTARVVLSGPQAEVAAIEPDEVRVLLRAPEVADGARAPDLSWRKDDESGAIQVELDGPRPEVEIERVEPRRFSLEREP
ncbi:hypothetical protein L6R53_17260 [Myxococcota bacterium]|nr:hypothetical protein [Myxococcota bacterium]